jgi:16S rRNA (cytosine967-C5)-methyltransferase
MSFFSDHLLRIIDSFPGHPPLPAFLRGYFKGYPILGSRDRKALSEAAFIYYRCRPFYPASVSYMDVVASGFILCKSSNVFLQKMLGDHLTAKLEHFAEPAITSSIKSPLSPAISTEEWLRSMWQQPQLFIRLRKHKSQEVTEQLRALNIPYTVAHIPGNADDDCLMLPNGTAIDKMLAEDAYVVQDWASQASMYQLMTYAKNPVQVWDVCSGAGGKSILLKEKLPPFQLLATDIRDSILHNLKMRFRLYGLSKAKAMVVDSADATNVKEHLGEQQFDLVLCDVPCSGSGTWARTPEQFHFFKDEHLGKFESLQYAIAQNAAGHLAKNGIMAYVTCSVFRQENEDVVERLKASTGLELLHQQIINGIPEKADCMFIAVLRKN